jgi:hypothetical protein
MFGTGGSNPNTTQNIPLLSAKIETVLQLVLVISREPLVIELVRYMTSEITKQLTNPKISQKIEAFAH